MNMFGKHWILTALIILAFFLRIWNLEFPFFTSDEARIANRGYSLSHFGEDELGRRWPVIFNSSNDYQLPLISYITAAGAIIPGQADITTRLPFVLIGTFLVLNIYLLSRIITGGSITIALINAFLAATSPVLIFISKVPNEHIILLFLLTLLLCFFMGRSGQKFWRTKIVISTILLIFTSKLAWFILPPLFYFVLKSPAAGSLLHLTDNNKSNRKFMTIVISVICLVSVVGFMMIPQGLRSLKENNLSFFSDISVSNGINYLRGEGLKANMPPLLEKLLFNKLHFLTAGALHWLTYLQPNVQFTKFDPTGVNSYSDSGAWSAILIIPFIGGLIYLLRKNITLAVFLAGIIIVTIFPGLFVLSEIKFALIILCLPFIGLIISIGLSGFRKGLWLLFGLIVLVRPVIINFDLSTEKLKTSDVRPGWIKPIVLGSRHYVNWGNVFISDNILNSALPFFQLYGKFEFKNPDVTYPYRFTSSDSKELKFLLQETKFVFCDDLKPNIFFVTKRDFEKINGFIKVHSNGKEPKILKTFKDDLGEEKIYLLTENICLK